MSNDRNPNKKKAAQSAEPLFKLIAQNKQARRNFEIEAEFEAGLVLNGPEVKSLRAGNASLNEAYCKMDRNGEMWLVGAHIAEYVNAGYSDAFPTRMRKLLLKKHELKKIAIKLIEKGYTAVPMRLYWKGAHVKLEFGLGRGKKQFDKRQDVANRDSKRELARELKSANQK